VGVLEDLLEEVRSLRQEVATLREAKPEPSVLLDADGAAALLLLTPEAISTLAKRGRIPSILLPNRRRRFDRDALLAWARSSS
jgi:hypothetical protein